MKLFFLSPYFWSYHRLPISALSWVGAHVGFFWSTHVVVWLLVVVVERPREQP